LVLAGDRQGACDAAFADAEFDDLDAALL